MMNATNSSTYSTSSRQVQPDPLHTMSSTSMSPTLFFEEICPDDVAGKILLYCDFQSAMTFVRCTNKVLTTRYEKSTDLLYVWLEIYHRHGFCPLLPSSSSSSLLEKEEDDSSNLNANMLSQAGHDVNSQQRNKQQDTIITQTLLRRKLLMNLFQKTKFKNNKQCLNLPHRYFKFLPILPSNIMDIIDVDEQDLLHFDPPPIFYECDSFVLTSSGNESELVLLNPFDGTLSVLKNIQDYCISSSSRKDDEGMLQLWETTMSSEGSLKNYNDSTVLSSSDTASLSHHHHQHHHPRREEQQLLDSNDYFQFDIAPYFPNRDDVQLSEEYELSFMGIDAKPILDDNRYNNSANIVVVGSMIGIGRSVRNIQENDIVCTELTAWKRRIHDGGSQGCMGKSNNYGHKMVCRFPWMFHLVDMDPNNERFFVSFHMGDGPFGHIERQDAANASTTSTPSSRLIVYPMIEELDDSSLDSYNEKGLSTDCNNRNRPTNIIKFFPEPILTIDCGDSVSSFMLDATGNTLVVTTSGGNLQLWNVAPSNNKQQQPQQRARLIQQIPLLKALKSCIKSCILSRSQSKMIDTATETSTTNNTDNGIDDGIGNMSSLAALRQHLEAPRFQAPVHSICVSKHSSVLKASPKDGKFVTLHRHPNDGTSLLLWQQSNNQIMSLINLPLSPRRSPRVFYEENRIIVFGEDHIGMIILVYAISCNDVDIIAGLKHEYYKEPAMGEERSGGVYNLTSQPAVQFVNRIRHVALGGIDSFDSIHMTCNERYLIVNTRTGNLLGECPYPEGLLVIDLQD